jgi:exonuclease III
MADNAFTRIDDWVQAQELADSLSDPEVLDTIATSKHSTP